MTTEKEVIKHLAKWGRYFGEGSYGVSWNGRGYWAKEPRALVVAICRDEGIPVKP